MIQDIITDIDNYIFNDNDTNCDNNNNYCKFIKIYNL
jgi:hypothetical protein